MTINTCELTKTIEKLVEKDEKEFESELKNFIQETNGDGKNFAQKYSEIQISYLGSSGTLKSLGLTRILFMASVGYVYLSMGFDLLPTALKQILSIIGLLIALFALIILIKPDILFKNFKKIDNKIKHYKDIILKIEEEKYR